MTKACDIVLPATMWNELHGHLIRGEGAVSRDLRNEQMAFILASRNTSSGRTRLIGCELLLAQSGDLEHQSPSGIGPNASFVARALTRCRQEDWSLIEVHSHPFDSSDSTTFSGIDWGNDHTKMPQLAHMFPAPFHHATMVVGQNSIDAHFYDRESASIQPVETLTVVGSSPESDGILRILPTSSFSTTPSASVESRHERQIPLIGAATQELLPKVSVAVVGLGGLGSFVCLELAHLGVGNLILIDPDIVEATNLNRLIGAQESDIGRPKVDVFHDRVKAISPTTNVTAIAASILDTDAIDSAKAADLILGCVDNHGARLVLNHLAIRYLIPFIDAGTGATLAKDGIRSRVGGQVQLVAPGLGCLECRGFINPQQAAFDLATPEMQAYERSHGYGTDSPAPSVIFLNGVVASMQVAEAIRVLGTTPLSGKHSVRAMVMYDALAQKAFSVAPHPSPDCVTCGVDGVMGIADLAPIHVQASDSRRPDSVPHVARS